MTPVLFPYDPKEYEQLCTRLLWSTGFQNTKRIGGSGDRGLDIICFDEHGNKIGVQCKRYSSSRKVTSREVREFIGALSLYKCNRGIFMTTSTLTREGKRSVRENILCFDSACVFVLTFWACSLGRRKSIISKGRI